MHAFVYIYKNFIYGIVFEVDPVFFSPTRSLQIRNIFLTFFFSRETNYWKSEFIMVSFKHRTDGNFLFSSYEAVYV